MGEDLNSLKICINVTGGGNIHPILPEALQHTTYLKKNVIYFRYNYRQSRNFAL